MRLLALFSLLCLAAEPLRETVQRGSVSATVEIDSQAVSLSGTLRVTLQVEGASPLRVTVPTNPLAREVATYWRIRPIATPKTERLNDTRERFEQHFEVSPYRAGESVPFRLAEILARDGSTTDEKSISWDQPFSIAVQTRVTDPTIQNLHPPTSIETLPGEPRVNDNRSWGHLLWFLLGIVLVAIIVVRWPRRQRGPLLAPYSREWTLAELERLRQSNLTPIEWCEQFAFILRHFIERERQIPATRFTSEELVESLPELPVEVSEVLAERLRLSDQIRFTSAELTSEFPFIPHDWISWSTTLVEMLSPTTKVADSREEGKDTEPK